MNVREVNRILLAAGARRALAMPGSSAFPSAVNVGTRTSTAFFPLDSKRELTPSDYRSLRQKSRFLRNASGLYRALGEKPVRYSIGGGLVPSSATGDSDFDKASDEYFENWAAQPVDVSGKYDFYTSQPMLATETHFDGDIFALKVRAQTGRCQLQFLKSHQIGDYHQAPDPLNRRFRNGISANSLDRPMWYRVLQDGRGAGSTDYRDYSAEDMLHVYDPLRFGLNRGLPWAYHGQNSAIDILDFGSLEKVAGKLNLALAGVITKTGARPGLIGPPADLASIFDGPRPAPEPSNDTPLGADGEPVEPRANGQISWESILGGGAMPVLEDGQSIEFLDLKRPSSQWVPSAEFFIRDIAIGYGVSYEFVWDMAALGGPGARFILEDLNCFCANDRRILISRYCQPVRSWIIADGIVHGALPECKTPNWHACNWTGPQDVTIDRGRMGALYRTMLEKGMLTLDEWWSSLGKDARKMRRARIDEIAEDMAYCAEVGIPYAYYCAVAAGTPAEAGLEADPTPSVAALDPALTAAIREAAAAAIAQALALRRQ